MSKRKRQIFLAILSFLPVGTRWRVHCWLRGRQETKRLRTADCVIVSYAKSGRTWLRVMLSRYYQEKYDLPKEQMLAFSNFNTMNSEIPKVLFTHDHYINKYTGNQNSKKDYYGKKVVLLVRDPRDVAVSSFFQWKYRIGQEKRELNRLSDDHEKITLFEFANHAKSGVEHCVNFLNGWMQDLPNIQHALVVRYEDLRADPRSTLQRILEFMGTPASDAELEDAVAFGAYENMKKMERGGQLATEGRRFGSGRGDTADAYKVRRGKIGGYRDYFSDAEAAHLDDLVRSKLSEELGYPTAPAAGSSSP